jgi:hypothetical protein
MSATPRLSCGKRLLSRYRRCEIGNEILSVAREQGRYIREMDQGNAGAQVLPDRRHDLRLNKPFTRLMTFHLTSAANIIKKDWTTRMGRVAGKNVATQRSCLVQSASWPVRSKCRARLLSKIDIQIPIYSESAVNRIFKMAYL